MWGGRAGALCLSFVAARFWWRLMKPKESPWPHEGQAQGPRPSTSSTPCPYRMRGRTRPSSLPDSVGKHHQDEGDVSRDSPVRWSKIIRIRLLKFISTRKDGGFL